MPPQSKEGRSRRKERPGSCTLAYVGAFAPAAMRPSISRDAERVNWS
jgi:hypothetical protein